MGCWIGLLQKRAEFSECLAGGKIDSLKDGDEPINESSMIAIFVRMNYEVQTALDSVAQVEVLICKSVQYVICNELSRQGIVLQN